MRPEVCVSAQPPRPGLPGPPKSPGATPESLIIMITAKMEPPCTDFWKLPYPLPPRGGRKAQRELENRP